MADKTALSIVLQLVDKTTAGVRAFQDRINGVVGRLTGPLKALGGSLAGLAKEAGVGKLVESIKGVGGALAGIAGKAALVGGAVVGAALGVKSLVDGFDDMGDLAERLGVSVDFIAQLRYAAERSGASVEELDGGLKAFTASLGQARAGTGKMLGFLKLVSPELAKQMLATKSAEEAFALLANAMAKLKDPAKRAALAQKTVGDAALAPLLARGAAGIDELRGKYAELAGSQEGAASAAGAVDDSMKDLHAAIDGIKAALVQGLGPALGQIVEELKAWFAENRVRIAEWSAAIGKKLPDAIHNMVEGFLRALDTVQSVIERIGGVKTVAIALAAVSFAPLASSVLSVVGAIARMSAAGTAGGIALAGGLGSVLVTVGAVTAAIVAATKAWEFLQASTGQRTGSASELLKEGKLGAIDTVKRRADRGEFAGTGWGFLDQISRAVVPQVDGIDTVTTMAPINAQALKTAAAARAAYAWKGESTVKIDIANLPRGSRVTTDRGSAAVLDLTLGYQMGGLQ